jgi:hypothetical protein
MTNCTERHSPAPEYGTAGKGRAGMPEGGTA